MIAGSLFSGIGGFDLGFARVGIRTVYQVEIDPKCNEVLARRFPECERHADVRSFEPIPHTDVIFGGFPCQDLSVAGRRAGLDGARSGLWREFFRVLAVALPRFCIIENVPGLLSSRRGRDFELLLQDLEQLGYRVAWRTLDAQYFGLAQRRKRVFIVGSLGDGSCAQVLFESESLRRDTAPRREARPDLAACLGGGAAGRGRRDNPDSSGAFVSLAPTLQSGSPTYERGDGSLFLAIDPPHGAIARPVTATSYKGHDEDTDTLIAGTLRGHPRPGSNDNGAIVFDTTQITSGENRSNPQAGDPCHPLPAHGHLATIAFQGGAQQDQILSPDQVAPCLAHSSNSHMGHHQPKVVQHGVRRLTPRECERLQGFPDDWTAGFADSHRYRMLGNAVAVTVAEWLARRLLPLLNRSASAASIGESPAVRASAGDVVGKPTPTSPSQQGGS